MQAPKSKEPVTVVTERSPIWLTVASIWAVVLLLTVYGAPAVNDEVTKDEELSAKAWLTSLAGGLMKTADTVGFSAVRSGLDRARPAVNAPYTVFELEAAPVEIEPVTPPPVPDAGLAPEVGEVVHHAAPAKKRVLVVGASSIQFAIGTELERRLPKYEGVKVRRFGKLATGLARPDFFDWPKKIEALCKTFKPDLIIANFGGNGAQTIPLEGYEQAKYPGPEWDAEYGKRVAAVVAIGDRHGADTVFLGMPNMRKKKFAAKMKYLNRVQKAAAEAAGALWIDTWAMSSTKGGKYRKSIKIGKKRGLMRTSDGVHYRKLGAKYVIDNSMGIIERRFALTPPDTKLATARPMGFDSLLLGERVSYTAFVPRGIEDAPIVYLLPDHGWSTWPSYPHREIQRAAQHHGVAVIVPEARWWVDGAGAKNATAFFEELLADVAAHVSTSESVAIAGIGTGGHGALVLGLREPGRFASVSALGGPMTIDTIRTHPGMVRLLGEDSQAWLQASPVGLAAEVSGTAPPMRLAVDSGALADTLTAAGVTVMRPKPESLFSLMAWHAEQLTGRPQEPVERSDVVY